ncbi:YebC/PmpR family DNA-binding transcriptional regulator [Candidatus Methylomicrobium oryzae]|jgi:YebC/PmpR family DNA-binding regulatory protein|uniref:YebC/PmpR family DNA-binding transcriptional regulator n=1 Tax=Candidatus Methylomicrobium oryzae TaxID=2802053 RepID=UPI0019250BFB|nr:YebC/PmpR family DNA-binding transcriptional regulator [Methylomicrobium sp. RS1]MBL1263995.1 YebC/PmpR family DNA-binding transcriptional regulator [Methylomicrobium sp. RS1]
MAGHSKWANIKHRKAGQDAKRGKIFTKLLREITVAVKSGGPDAGSNPTLRTAIDKALGSNMRRDTIDNAIKKASGAQEGANYEEVRYEGYGPGGTAVMVECLTDNRNRTVSDVRHAFTKAGGNLGTDGSVAYLFTKTGMLSYAESVDEDALMEAALEAGANDVVTNDDGSIDVMTSPEDYLAVKDALIAAGFTPDNAEVTMQASTQTELGPEDAEKMLRLIDRLEDLDDVQNVYSNADISEEIMAQFAG